MITEVATADGSWASIGDQGKLVCHTSAAPSPSFQWKTRDGLDLTRNTRKYVIHKPQVSMSAILIPNSLLSADALNVSCLGLCSRDIFAKSYA